MRHIVVTGANKGIGLAIVEAILREQPDTFVFLGTRDRERGEAAAAALIAAHPEWRERLEVLPVDVASDRSVAEAARTVSDRLAGKKLYALVNNAGIGHGAELATIVDTNMHGIKRTTDAFLPLLDPENGRLVNVTSAAGPTYVSRSTPEQRQLFVDPKATWPELRARIDETLSQGLDGGDAYGFSKACANAYTVITAREHPKLRVNACTPGFIETDLTRPYLVAQNKSAKEAGMKSPAEGARAPMHLLFDELDGNGRYYGSDAKRSPLDRYRAPGSPEYTGD